MVKAPNAASEVQVAIGAETGQFNKGIDGAINKLGSFGSKAGTVAAGGLAALGAAAGVVGGKAVSSASDFESAMADVAKVTSEGMAEDLEDDLMTLSEEIPVSRGELAKLAEQAGKFGAESEEEILQFVETTGKIQTATDLAAEEAGTRFAKIADAVGTPMSDLDELGNAVNSLADSMKTDTDEITQTAQRAGLSLSNRLGLGRDAVLGLSASFNELSATPRLAATSLEQLSKALTDPNRVEGIADAMGMSVEAFEKMRDESPQELMQKVSETLTGGTEASDELAKSMSSQQVEAFEKLASASESTADAQETVNKQFEDGTSLQREMELRTDTLQGQMQLLKDEVNNVFTELGQYLLPLVKDAVQGFSNLIDRTETFAKNALPAVRSGFRTTQNILSNVTGDVEGIEGAFSTAASGVKAAANGEWSTALTAYEDTVKQGNDAIRGLIIGDGEGGLAGMFDSAATDAQEWLQGEGSEVIGEGMKALGRAAVDTALNFHDILIGPDGEGGVLTVMVDQGTEFLKNTAPELFGDAMEAIGSGIRAGIIDMTNPLRGEESEFWNLLDDSATWVIENAPKIFEAVGEGIVDAIKEGASGLYDGLVGNSVLKDDIKDSAQWIKDNISDLVGGVGGAIVGEIVDSLENAGKAGSKILSLLGVTGNGSGGGSGSGSTSSGGSGSSGGTGGDIAVDVVFKGGSDTEEAIWDVIQDNVEVEIRSEMRRAGREAQNRGLL